MIRLVLIAAVSMSLSYTAEARQAELESETNAEALTALQEMDLQSGFMNALLVGCISQISGVLVIEIGDEAMANSAGLSIGAPKDIEHREYLPLALGLPGGAQLYEQPVHDALMAIAVGRQQCRIGIFDAPSIEVSEAIEAGLLAEGSPWKLVSNSEPSKTYAWDAAPVGTYKVELTPRTSTDRLALMAEVTHQ